jgi:hypothetical protein
VKQEKDRDAAADHRPQIGRTEFGDSPLGSDDVAHQRAGAEERNEANDGGERQDEQKRLPGDAPDAGLVSLALLARQHRGRRDGEAVAQDRSHRGELVGDADGAERCARGRMLEPRENVSVDEIERGLQAHADGERRAEARDLSPERAL